ncbi:MAG: hypothetical protein AAGJ09_00560 [Pseudomonadota bacterium]
MTYQAPLFNGLSNTVGAPVCALVQTFGTEETAHLQLTENLARIRRQLDALRIKEVFGLGDIPAGSSLLLLRADVLFEFSGLTALAAFPGQGAYFGGCVAALHVEGGDAAAALAKFRRQETAGWQPFQIQFWRLGAFNAPFGRSFWPFGRGKAQTIAKAAYLDPAVGLDKEDQMDQDVWQSLPGLDRFVRSNRVTEVQRLLNHALNLKPSGWQGIGFLLLLVMLSFGTFGWVWLGAAIGLFAAGAFDLGHRLHMLQDLRLTHRSQDLCLQALVVSCLWLFAVFSAGYGATAQMPALVLIALPFAFIAALANRRVGKSTALDSVAFGVFGQGLLVCGVVSTLPIPLLSLFLSAFGLILMTAVAIAAALQLTVFGLTRRKRLGPPISMSQPAE